MAMTKSSKATMAEASGQKLLDAAVPVIRAKGYSAARVEDIRAEAGLTKGAFFHHFASKETKARHARAMRQTRHGRRKARRFIHRLSSRARSFSPRPSTALKSPRTASIISRVISRRFCQLRGGTPGALKRWPNSP
jgi:AcrR family transcriptional regulator